MYNPFQMQFPYPSYSPSSVEIPHVNGQNGAQAYQMPSNSSVLLLDDNAPIVYLVRTDSACYKTIKPYTITEYQPEPTVDMRSLLNRIETIERKLNNESNTSTNESTSIRSNKIVDEYDTSKSKSYGSNSKLFNEQSSTKGNNTNG